MFRIYLRYVDNILAAFDKEQFIQLKIHWNF